MLLQAGSELWDFSEHGLRALVWVFAVPLGPQAASTEPPHLLGVLTL